jgi:hypothetical protein
LSTLDETADIPPASEPPTPDVEERRPRGRRTLRLARNIVIALLVVAGLVGIGYFTIHRVHYTRHATASFADVERVVVAVSGNGSVTVHQTSASDVTVTATDISTLLDSPHRQMTEVDGTLYVVASCDDAACHTSYDVAAPANTSISVMIDHALETPTVSVTGISAPVEVTTAPGNVALANLSGTVQVVASGDVSGTGLSGRTVDVTAPTAKDVSLAMTTAPTALDVATALPGTVELSLPAGNYRFDPSDASYRLNSVAIMADPTSSNVISLNLASTTTAVINQAP